LGALVLLLKLRGRNIAQWLKDALRVEPGDPFQRRVLDVFEASPRPTQLPSNDSPLEKERPAPPSYATSPPQRLPSVCSTSR